MATGADLVRASLLEIGVVDPIETVTSELQTLGLEKVNRIINDWNADHGATYVEEFASHTLTPSLNPHTIGSSGTFTVSQRPVSIEFANIVVSGIRYPVSIEDAEWYANMPDRTVETSIPTNLYYAPGWPNGSLYLYPIPDAANSLELWTRAVLSALTASGTVTLPPGYENALMLTLAESLTNPLSVSVPPLLAQQAREARGRVWANNITSPRIATRDSGVPSSGAAGGFNWETGTGGGRTWGGSI